MLAAEHDLEIPIISMMIERFSQMPSALRSNARWLRLGRSQIPALVVHPHGDSNVPVPIVIWMHGRTVNKELDPGRYLRWMRAGIGVCAVDLPGHGERFDQSLQDATRSFDVVRHMTDEVDEVASAIHDLGMFDMKRIGIGGMSAGGMATLSRLCRPHPFICASVEATTGSWFHHGDQQRFRQATPEIVHQRNPIEHLDTWREIPLQAIHARLDEWVPIEGQIEFIESLRSRYRDPKLVELVVFDRTGAPNEHAGFGQFASEAKDLQRDFFRKFLLPEHPA